VEKKLSDLQIVCRVFNEISLRLMCEKSHPLARGGMSPHSTGPFDENTCKVFMTWQVLIHPKYFEHVWSAGTTFSLDAISKTKIPTT
jgi:hypothetical protein